MENRVNKKYVVDDEFIKTIKELINKSLIITIAVPSKMSMAAEELEIISAKALSKLIEIEPYK